jgi:hypothetical protein
MTKEKFAESGYPDCNGIPHVENKRGGLAVGQDDDGAA